MNKISILNKIITNIGKQESLINIILIPKDVSKTYISSVLKSNSIKNTNIYYMDEYVFKVNKIDQKKLIHDDAIYLENILSETDSIFDKYNLTQESENIINLINNIFIEKNILIDEKNKDENKIIKNISKDFMSFESQIFLEIIKIWVNKSINGKTYINSYMRLLRSSKTQDNTHYYIIEREFFSSLELNWAIENLKNITTYDNNYEENIHDKNFVPKNLSNYETLTFSNREDELDFVAKDIEKNCLNNKIKSIALINNDRYFARRLRAILDRKNIKINDYSGWLLSTSTCCSYINNILKFFIENNSYVNLHDILLSPYFMPDVSLSEKNIFLKNSYLFQKDNINASLDNFIHNKINANNNLTKLFINPIDKKELYTFLQFKKILTNILIDFNSQKDIEDDEAGKEFYKAIKFMEEIHRNNSKEFLYSNWYKKLMNYLESKTFQIPVNSKIYYTDIKHALLYNFDKIYINSLSNVNYPKRLLNNFSINNIISSDFSISSNKVDHEKIEDFLNLSNNTKNIILSSHKTDNNQIFTDSKFKIYIDHFLKNKVDFTNAVYNTNIDADATQILRLEIDRSFTSLTYRDIENFNTCFYCFYFNKKSPRVIISNLSHNYAKFGSFAHSVLNNFVEEYLLINKSCDFLASLRLCSAKQEEEFYLDGNTPYEVKLFNRLLPKISDYFYSDILKKYNFHPEKILKTSYLDNIRLSGRCDLKYSIGSDNIVVDYKTGSSIPTKISVTNGINLQLPFYTLLDSTITTAQYMVINASKNSIEHKIFTREQLSEARNIIFQSLDKIDSLISDNAYLKVKKSPLGCEVCGYLDVDR